MFSKVLSRRKSLISARRILFRTCTCNHDLSPRRVAKCNENSCLFLLAIVDHADWLFFVLLTTLTRAYCTLTLVTLAAIKTKCQWPGMVSISEVIFSSIGVNNTRLTRLRQQATMWWPWSEQFVSTPWPLLNGLLRLWACVYGLNERGYFVYFQPFIRSGVCVQLYQMRSPEVRITLAFILRVPTFITGRFSK